jgi:glucose/arabinose dehydrogenase
MRLALLFCVTGVGLLALAGWWTSQAADTPPADPWPVGIDHRIPWTTSRVVGSPNPPLPYRVKPAFPKLKIVCPIGVAHEPGSDRLLIIHQDFPWGGRGRIVRIKDDPAVETAEPFLTIDGIAYGVAFHPDFAKNGYLFVGYNGPYDGKAKFTRVSRYTMARQAPHAIVPGSEKLIIEWSSDGHNGGDLAFANDGMLCISSGDGTSDSDTDLAGQDLTRLRAKVLRIDVDHPDPGKTYSVPKDNPFVGMPGVRPETWAYGFRNPWRLHIDKASGDLWIGQNGQDLWEQIYLVQKGANYGWSVVEGSHPFYPERKAGPQPISKPIVEHSHSEARSMTGGVVYHGKKFPDLQGAYIYGDWSTGKIWGVRHKEGKATWHKELVSSIMQITGFGADSHGELLICDHGGNALFRLEPTTREVNPPKFPTRLSETGLYTSVKGHQVDPALIPYTINAPFWSDGALKERFIALPGAERIDFGTNRGWNFTDGAVIVKTFTLMLEEGNPASKRRIETRLLTRQQGQWAGYSYLWNDEQTDAELVAGEGMDRAYEIRDAKSPGGRRQQVWHYPSRTECMVCHSRAANWVLGLTEMQMNKIHDYSGRPSNQLRTLEHLGVFRINYLEHVGEMKRWTNQHIDVLQNSLRAPLEEVGRQQGVASLRALSRPVDEVVTHVRQPLEEPINRLRSEIYRPLEELEKDLRETARYTTLLPRRPQTYRTLVDPYDHKADLDLRARSWLHTNCSQCHVMSGGGNAMIELEINTARDKMNVVNAKPQHATFDIPDARLIVPGHPEKSVLFQRISRRGQGQMPPLATAMVDQEAVELLREWIKTMPADYDKMKK